MTAHAAVGVDDDLAPGHTAVTHGAANDEAPRRVNVDDRRLGKLDALVLQNRHHDVVDDALADRCIVDVVGMLRRDDDLFDVDGLAVDVARGPSPVSCRRDAKTAACRPCGPEPGARTCAAPGRSASA